ncbi:MAG: hypothetical protein ACRCZ2_01180 [Fusobacteriaceae bacterium]
MDAVAKDIVHHFLNRSYQGKAMIVSIDKLTTLRMVEKVRAELLGALSGEADACRHSDATPDSRIEPRMNTDRHGFQKPSGCTLLLFVDPCSFAFICGFLFVRVEIEKMLDSGLPEKYTTELFEQKCGVLFQHVLEKYPESGESVYEAAG